MYLNYGIGGIYPNYNSPLSAGSMAKRHESGYAASSKKATDAFCKRGGSSKKRDYSGFLVAGLALASVFVGYKGKNAIKRGVNACGDALKGIGTSFTKHCPNMSNACSSFAKACNSPVRGIKKVGSGVAKVCSAPFKFVKNIFHKTK